VICKGCEYLNWTESNEEGGTCISVTYICIHPLAKSIDTDKVNKKIKGYVITIDKINQNKFMLEIGNVEQPLWCPFTENDGIY